MDICWSIKEEHTSLQTSLIESSDLKHAEKIMALKLTLATVALAAYASAANYKRVACPDGVNTATNEAVRIDSF